MSVAQSPHYTEVRVSDHAYQRWDERSSRPQLNPRVAWLEAIPVEYPGMRPPAEYARYHEPTDLVLLVAGDGTLTTVIPLMERPQSEQQHVLAQVTDA